jgi:hypothetical protein
VRLSFPNPSRSFDATTNGVRFWGYDSAIEVVFFVETAALKKLCPDVSEVEDSLLKAFDTVTKQIHEAAEHVYARGSKRLYACRLAAEDF